jgi:hypothetical protein
MFDVFHQLRDSHLQGNVSEFGIDFAKIFLFEGTVNALKIQNLLTRGV